MQDAVNAVNTVKNNPADVGIFDDPAIESRLGIVTFLQVVIADMEAVASNQQVF